MYAEGWWTMISLSRGPGGYGNSCAGLVFERHFVRRSRYICTLGIHKHGVFGYPFITIS